MPKRSSRTPTGPTPDHLDRLVRSRDATALQTLAQDPSVPAQAWTVTAPNPYAFDPLLVSAVVNGGLELIPVLLQVCDPHETTSFGDTAFMAAALHGKLDAIEALLPVSDASRQNKAGQNALMLAIEGIGGASHAGHMACIDKLIPASDLHAGDDHGMTALLIVASHARAAKESSEDPTPYWTCADKLAEGSRREEALRVLQQAPKGSMPRFTAVLERESLLAAPDAKASATSVARPPFSPRGH